MKRSKSRPSVPKRPQYHSGIKKIRPPKRPRFSRPVQILQRPQDVEEFPEHTQTPRKHQDTLSSQAPPSLQTRSQPHSVVNAALPSPLLSPLITTFISPYTFYSLLDRTTPQRFHDPSPSGNHDSGLATEILQCLTNYKILPVVPELENDIRVIGNRYRLHMLGIIKGRDISRAAIAERDKTIARLKERIAAMKTELRMTNAQLTV